MKRCSICREVKAFEAFSRQTRSTDGLQSICRACYTERSREPAIQAKRRAYRERPEIKERTRARYFAERRVRWEQQLFREYGIDFEDWARMFERQRGLCSGCVAPLRAGRYTHLDHCHATGRVRGLLCNGCNAALGWVRDSVETLRRLALYLERQK